MDNHNSLTRDPDESKIQGEPNHKRDDMPGVANPAQAETAETDQAPGAFASQHVHVLVKSWPLFLMAYLAVFVQDISSTMMAAILIIAEVALGVLAIKSWWPIND